MSDKPTGEWTVEYVILLGVDNYEEAKQIADAHNAALAAERECTCDIDTICRVHGCPHCYELEKQLATERVKWNDALEANRQTEKLLAAEREKVETLRQHLDIALREREELRAQLAAEREKAKTLVDALESIRGYLVEQSNRRNKASFADQRAGSDAQDLLPIADAALAKIGGK